MRIHLGHHFYGAGNLGDDFMLAGFLGAMRHLAPSATYTCCVPFALEPLRLRFPEITWFPANDTTRDTCISACDAWLGLGGSPFQSAQSRWFIDHLVADAAACDRAAKPMFFLGVGVQTEAELKEADVQPLCARAAGIWTRDLASTEKLRGVASRCPVTTGADLAHLFFQDHRPPAARRGRVTMVANFDFGAWPGQPACLRAVNALTATERIWLAQESRTLPGAEHALFATLPPATQTQWTLVSPEQPGAPLTDVLSHWPSGEWLITARYHAAMAGAWSGSKIVVVATNEKLRAAAHELGAPLIPPEADERTVRSALEAAAPAAAPHALAEQARQACADFLRSAVAHQR